MLISFHEYDLLYPLLSKLPGANFEIKHTTLERQVENISRTTGSIKDPSSSSTTERNISNNSKPLNVFLARKISGGELDYAEVCTHVHACNDDWFTEYQPLLTRTRTESIQSAFEKPLKLPQAYKALFTEAEREHLTDEHFLEDCQAFLDGKEQIVESLSKQGPPPTDIISCNTALEFLKTMQ